MDAINSLNRLRSREENVSDYNSDESYDEDADDSWFLEEEDDEDHQEVGKEVRVNFEACPIGERDLNGIIKFLKQIFLHSPFDFHSLAKYLISKQDVGLIIKQCDESEESEANQEEGSEEEQQEDESENEKTSEADEDNTCQNNENDSSGSQERDDTEKDDNVDESDPTKKNNMNEDDALGVSSFVDLHSKNETTKPVVKYLLEASKNKKPKVQSLFDNNFIVWVINERFINLPWELSLAALEQIANELQSSAHKFDYYLMICKVLHLSKTAKPFRSSGSKRLKTASCIFQNSEEEIFYEQATYDFEFSVEDMCDPNKVGGDWDENDEQYVPHRKVLFLNPEGWKKSLKTLQDLRDRQKREEEEEKRRKGELV